MKGNYSGKFGKTKVFFPGADAINISSVNFINGFFLRTFFCTNVLFVTFSTYVLALTPKFRTKNARVNVDEIDTWTPSLGCLDF